MARKFIYRFLHWLGFSIRQYPTGLVRKQYKSLSRHLKRKVTVDVYAPEEEFHHIMPVLVILDGQDLYRMKFQETLTVLHRSKSVPGIVVVAIHADENRMQEYGTGIMPDYKGRGSKARQHQLFIVDELIPQLEKEYPIKLKNPKNSIAGWSLGGLAAFDTAWNFEEYFKNVGVFSGSFWWRSKPMKSAAPDADLIVHSYVKDGNPDRNHRYWFQAGTLDETSDRNNNGIIDAIDDTLQLIDILKAEGNS